MSLEDLGLEKIQNRTNNEYNPDKLFIEKSIWDNIVSIEEKIKKVKYLFNNLNINELEEEDVRTSTDGWNMTKNVQEIGFFKINILRSLSEGEPCPDKIPCFYKLINQKIYQDIVWVTCDINPKIFNGEEGNIKFNSFIKKCPDFLESKEFRKVRLEHIKNGIKKGYIFEGIKHYKDAETKIHAINEGEEMVADLSLYEYDSSQIDFLEEKEKEEAKGVFVQRIKDYTLYDSIFGNISGYEIILVGKKLGFTEEYLNDQIFISMLNGVSNICPPKNDIDKELKKIYDKIKKTLLDPEKRQDLLKVIYANISSSDFYFDSWKDSFEYVELTNEELKKAREVYLDFSSSEVFENKCNDIFCHPWFEEKDFNFSKEERLTAFSTMNSKQRSSLIRKYDGSISKLDYLSFTNEDILEFGVSSVKLMKPITPDDIDQVKKTIQYNFPSILINDNEIKKRVIFNNLVYIDDIKESLLINNIEMSNAEIIDRFSSPRDFVLKQIRGVSLDKLKALQKFKDEPETPNLPNFSLELFNEIKKHILSQKYEYSYGRVYFKAILFFVPREYKISVLSDPDLQKAFSNYYKNALRKNDLDFIGTLRYLISSTENLYNPEQKVFKEYIKNKDYFNLITYYKTLKNSRVNSVVVKEIEDFFKRRLKNYGSEIMSNFFNSDVLEKTLKDISLQKLNQLTPENLVDEELTQEWFNIYYGPNYKERLRVFNLIKKSKDFLYFDKEIKSNLFKGNLSEKFICTLQDVAENNPEYIDRALEFIKYVIGSRDCDFVDDNYDYLYKKLFKLDTTEYKAGIDLLTDIKPVISSPLISGINFQNLFNEIYLYNEQDRNKFFNLINTETYRTNPDSDLGWAKNTILYYANKIEELKYLHRDSDETEKIVRLFSVDYKNMVLDSMRTEWINFLIGDAKVLSPQISLVSEIIGRADGAGNMKHIESLGGLICQVKSTLNNKKTTSTTVEEMKDMLSVLENRFSREKWSQDDISEFYNLSKDILEAAPSLYTTLGPIFENISSSKDMKKFMSDIFPFYKTQLLIQQNISDENITYDPRGLVEMRRSIKEFVNKLEQDKNETDVFESEKLRLLEIAKDGFKNRFGLLKVPDSFTKENLRSVQNVIRYIGNIRNRTFVKESLLSLYLGLELDNKWSDFRGGKEINFGEYISPKQLQTIAPLLEEKQKSYELLSETSGIGMDRMSKFQDLLQKDVSSNLIGDIQTIDIKLGNIKRNIDELIDPDIYQTVKEKDILEIFLKEGKNVNVVLAKLYGISTGKNIKITEEEKNIKQKIESIFSVSEWTPSKVKEIQEEIQPIGLVTGMVNKIQEEKVEENIAEIQASLIPNNQIIEIFKKLGEEFHQESGALALSKDLSYLENIVIKDANKITDEEKEIVKNYIDSIRGKMNRMENILDNVKQYFIKIKKSSHIENNPVLKSRISEIEKVIYSQDISAVITSQMTKDLNLIIENMRKCLSCIRKESNNDTNLAFGDYNKFFMINQTGKEKSSISDEIVFFIPVTMRNGYKEMSFVMDQVYGLKSSDMLLANISTVYKKYQVLKKEFPDARLSVSVTSSAMESVGLDENILEKKLREVIEDKIEISYFEDLNAFIPKSSLSDNYVEFGEDLLAREFGERRFSGLVLR